MYLISLYFDDKSNSILQRYIDRVAAATGNTFMQDHNVPPHMTLTAVEARSVDVLVPAFESLRGKVDRGEIQFVSLGQLLPYVFYVTPVLNDYLSNLLKTVYDEFKTVPETSVSRFYKPSSWLPHVTVGKTLSKEQMLKALDSMQGDFSPFTATVTRIGLAKVNPHEDVSSILLEQK